LSGASAPAAAFPAGWLRVLLSAVILGWLASRLDLTIAAQAIIDVRLPHLAAALGLIALDRCIMIARWQMLLRASGIVIRTTRVAEIFLVSEFVSSGLAGAVAADATRAFALHRHGVRPATSGQVATGGEALASVVVDRLLGTLSLALMAAAGLLAWSSASPISPQRTLAAIAAMLALGAGTFWADRVITVVAPRRAGAGRMGSALIRLSDAISRYRGHARTLAAVFALCVTIQVIRVAGAWILGLGLGLAVPFAYYLWFMPLALLVWLMPVSVAGFGLPQGVFVWLLHPAGVPDAAAFALSTLIVVTGLTGNIPGLVLWLRKDREIL
jgi:glycosyltransferase 2 family protein